MRSLKANNRCHHPRFTPSRLSLGGRVEERMPFLALALPATEDAEPGDQDTVEAWRRNLRSNGDRLVSHFDIHRTLAHFVTRDSGVTRDSNTSHGARAPVSLLDTVVSPNRTCQQVGR